jgi:hypothetical protein
MFILILLCGLPLLGVWLDGQPIGRYLQFPPRTNYVAHAPFAWPVFIALSALIAAMVLPFLIRRLAALRRPSADVPRLSLPPLPWWGSGGLAIGAAAWTLAWTRFEWFRPLQPHTFTPLWLAYILVVNGLTWQRSGHCMLTDRPRHLAWLFLASAAFWWFFEYLNRFVQNWYYAGIQTFSPLEYFLFASLSFSTVLPAVMGTAELLRTFPALTSGLDSFPPVRVRRPRAVALAALTASAAGLTGIGLWPDRLFPLLWLAPVMILISLQALRREETLLSPLAQGDWRRIVLLALSALICGFFWEMWNYRSLAQWIYTVPYVNRFHLFEMPILGYAGYLPFGMECAVVADAIANMRKIRSERNTFDSVCEKDRTAPRCREKEK